MTEDRKYISYSEFVRRDPDMQSMDSSGGEGAYDFSKIEAAGISAEEKEERKKIAQRSIEDYFDWKHPMRIYQDEVPRFIQVGSGGMRGDESIPGLETFYEEMRRSGGALDKKETLISKNAVLLQFYRDNDPSKSPRPVFHMYTGIRKKRTRLEMPAGLAPMRIPIPSWILAFSKSRTPHQVLREGALCAKLIATRGIRGFLLESFFEDIKAQRCRTPSHRSTEHEPLGIAEQRESVVDRVFADYPWVPKLVMSYICEALEEMMVVPQRRHREGLNTRVTETTQTLMKAILGREDVVPSTRSCKYDAVVDLEVIGYGLSAEAGEERSQCTG